MNLPKCSNCKRYINDNQKHIHMAGGWCEVIIKPKFVKSTAKKSKA